MVTTRWLQWLNRIHGASPTRTRRSSATRQRQQASRRLNCEALEDRVLPALTSFTALTLRGDYVAAGVGLRDKTDATLSIAGIPADSSVKSAYLYYGYLDNGESAALKNITFAGTAFTGTRVGSGPDTCWGRTGSFAYRADVTSKVTGNADYALTGVASGGNILAEGASLVVIYTNPTAASRKILLYNGDDVVNSSGATASNTFGGFTIVDPASAKTTFIMGDGQTGDGFDDTDSFTGSQGTRNLDNTFSGGDGAHWDTRTFDVTAQVAAGDTSVSASIGIPASGGDCLMWVAQVLSVATNTIDIVGDTNRDGTITPDDEKGKDTVTKDRGAIYNVNFDDDNEDGIPDAVSFNDTAVPAQTRNAAGRPAIENATDALDIAPVVIRKLGKLPANTKVFLKVPVKEDIQSIQVYKRIAAGEEAIWGGLGDRVVGGVAQLLEIDVTAHVSETADTTFGIEGLFFRNTGTINTFDGNVELTLELRDAAGVVGSDKIQMKVAPWLMISNAEASTIVFAADANRRNDTFRKTRKADPGYVGLDDSGQLREVTIRSVLANPENRDQWIQDHIEIGYTQRPGGPKEHVVFRLPRPVGGVLPTWPLTELLGSNVGVFAIGRSFTDAGGGSISGSFGGNLEVIPPTAKNKLGTIVIGDTRSDQLFTFLNSQSLDGVTSAQPIVQVPTRWLTVGHVDEVVGFTGNGNQVVVADTTDAYNQLGAIPVADRDRTVFFATGAAPVSGAASADSMVGDRLETGLDLRRQGWNYVRIISGPGAGQVAHIKSLRNGFIEIDKVWDTGTTITPDTVGIPAPTLNAWFAGKNPRMGDRYVLVENTQFWFDRLDRDGDGTPAFVTVTEVLADANLAAVNLVAQAKIDAIKSALDTAAGGAGTLSFVRVPVIYVGIQAGFDTNRRTVAYTPGLANVQPVAGKLYFPRQFGPKNAAGADIYESVTKARLADAVFVDDWDLYHRLDGEVHCGSVTKLTLPGFDWWTRLP